MVLADSANLAQFVGDTLTRAVWSAVDRECLNGSATAGPGFTGLNNIAGTSAAGPPAAQETMADVIARGLAAVRNAGFEPDGIVLNPSDFVTIQIAKETGSGGYLVGTMTARPAPTIWGVPAVPSPNLAAGGAIVGQFSSATLYVRECMTLSWAEFGEGAAGADLFMTNAVRARVETRCLLAVHVPAAFCKVDLVV
jgi:HK97 family phage major capsid protein